ncbi:MAG TPA: HEAT repeat domain-containing protein [Anaeromyxobacteraceae bacterium]|jgi:ATP/ADP translocase/HEAT repeat protein|nr:HEAT repeat domain-containing protein [Anaeromyxobacteraceae bacterium]
MRDELRARDRWLEAAFRVHPGELRATLLLFLLSFTTVGAFVVGRAVRDAIFLARLSPARLPFAYVAAAAAVALAGAGHARLAGRRRPAALLAATSAAFAVLAVAARLAFEGGGGQAAALYLGVEVMGALTVVQFWTVASEVHDARAARRLFGVIGAGGTLANVLVGLAVRVLAPRAGVANLLWLCAALLAGSAALITRLPRPAAGGPFRLPAAPAPWRSPHLRAIGALVLLTAVCAIFLDYQLKSIAAAHFRRDPVALAAFFGAFSGALGAAALALQLFATGRALERLGLFGALFVLPAAFGAGAALLLVAPVLWAAAAAKAGEDAIRYTVHDAGSQILYLPLPPRARARAKALADGVLKPAGIALAGLLLAGLSAAGASPKAIAAATLLLSGAWASALAALRPRYAAELRAALLRGGSASGGVPLDEPGAADALRAALRSEEPGPAARALELAGLADLDLADEALPLLSHPDADLRRRACDHLGIRPRFRHAGALLARCVDPEPRVRAAAARSACAVLADEALAPLTPLLSDPHPAVRAAAVEGLLRHGGLDGVVSAAAPLRALCGSPQPEDRAAAARVLGGGGVRGFYKPLHALMADPDARVRRAAVTAAGRLRAPELAPALVYLLGEPDLAGRAAVALSAHGAAAERVLGKALANPREDLAVRRAIPPVLAGLGTAAALERVAAAAEDPDRTLRLRAQRAAAALLSARPDLPADRVALGRACERELGRAWRALAAAAGLAPDRWREPPALEAGDALRLLREALREKGEASGAAALELAAALQPEAALAAARLARPAGGRQRPHAVELLDTVLDPRLQRRLVPLVEDWPAEAKLRAAEALYDLPRRRPAEWVGELLRDESGWVAAVAAHLAGALRLEGCAADLAALANGGEATAREAARAALASWDGGALAPREVTG